MCPCLNVSVSCSQSDGGCWNARPTQARRLFPEGSKDRLVSSDSPLYEIDLDVAGVFAVSLYNKVIGRERERLRNTLRQLECE